MKELLLTPVFGMPAIAVAIFGLCAIGLFYMRFSKRMNRGNDTSRPAKPLPSAKAVMAGASEQLQKGRAAAGDIVAKGKAVLDERRNKDGDAPMVTTAKTPIDRTAAANMAAAAGDMEVTISPKAT